MNSKILFLSGIFIYLLSSQSQASKLIKITNQSGVYIETLKNAKPDSDGIVQKFDVSLPAYVSGYFFADYNYWPANDNRLYPWFFKDSLATLFSENFIKIPTLKKPDRSGSMMILKLKSGKLLTLFLLASQNAVSRLYVNNANKLTIEILTLGTEKLTGEIPVISWAESDNLYHACYQSWDLAASLPQLKEMTGRRENKVYPVMFNYLGWCSWENYKANINEKKLTEAFDNIERSTVPVRWLLIDDGHQDAINRELISFGTNPDKFPNGWNFLNDRKGTGKIKWTGLWHAFNGHWKGLNENYNLKNIETIKTKSALVVKNDALNAQKFYDLMVGTVAKDGFDFLKIDVQTRSLEKYTGTQNAVSATNYMTTALENACRKNNLGLINCMAMNAVNLFNKPFSSVMRVSQDYVHGNLGKARSHIFQSYASTLWLGYTVYPDHDMFHSSDSISGKLMAVSKAMSFAPIYLSDEPTKINAANVLPLCYSDGELLKPLAPAVPTQSSFFKNIFSEANPFLVVAPLANHSAAVVAYNLTEPELIVNGKVTTEDYKDASAMILPYKGEWSLPAEGLYVYNSYDKKGSLMNDGIPFSIPKYGDKLYIIVPVKDGWAVIGNIDKFLSPVAVSDINCTKNNLQLTVKEAGKYLIYSKNTPTCSRYSIKKMDDSLWLIDVTGSAKNIRFELNR